MSILIKGMEMPEYRDVFGDERGCVYLLMLTVNKDSTASMQFNDVDGGFYRVKEIPTPHGRLIDADELFCKIDGIKGWDYGDESDMAISAAEALSAIDDSPTIIEAEMSAE